MSRSYTWRSLLLLELLLAFDIRADSVSNTSRSDERHEFANSSYDSIEEERRLAVITNQIPQNQTALRLVPLSSDPPIECDPQAVPSCTTIDNIFAGLTIDEVEIVVVPDTFSADSARLRIVREFVTRDAARNGVCAQGEYETSLHAPANLNAPWGAEGVSTAVAGGILQAESQLTFHTGGTFRICYSQDGTFGFDTADLVPTLLSVNGVFDDSEDCQRGVACIFDYRYYCYVLKNAHNNRDNQYGVTTTCVVNYNRPDTGIVGPVPINAGTWSSAWGATYSTDEANDGEVISVTTEPCQTEPATFLCSTGGACDLGGPYIPPDEPDLKSFSLPVARNDLNTDDGTFQAYTVAACYCPNYGGCDWFPEFLQKVGVLHFFATKICRPGFFAQDCTLDFGGASPQYRFAVRIECPTDACEYTNANRMKIVGGSADNEVPAWDANTGCNTALHGFSVMRNRTVLPPQSNIPVEGVSGGLSQRMKLWNFHPDDPLPDGNYRPEIAGFLFNTGFSGHELRNSYNRETYDVCFCNADCESGMNWFKAGQVRFAAFRLVSVRNDTAETSADPASDLAIGYANQPGTIGFSRPPLDYEVMGLREGSIIKLVEDPMMLMDDVGCAAAPYDIEYVDPAGLQEGTAPTLYRGTQSEDGTKLVFNSGNEMNTIRVMRAGSMAICYCAFLSITTGLCEDDQWIFIHHTMLRGPIENHAWEFSTNVVFRFDFRGYGLTSEDKLRIVPGTAECIDDPPGDFTETNIRLECPDPCTEVGDVSALINGDVSISVLADDAYQCDKQNADCRTNDIKEIMVLDEQTTMLELENPTFMEDGDLISLGSDDGNHHIVCDDSPGAPPCTDEQLAVLLGRYRFADADTNMPGVPDEYLAGHAVRLDPDDSRKLYIPVGWPAPAPRFAVQYIDNKRGKWRRHNHAITREEVVGTRQRVDLKVCWKPATLGKYIAQVGTLALRDPNPMSECQVSLMTSVESQLAPFIVSFRTASAQTGLRYAQVHGPTQLKFFFHDQQMLGVFFTDDSAINANEAEDEAHEARQYICGRLFKEIWSSDQEFGFPMPQGCYYRVYGDTVEMNMLFSEKSGLRAGQNYQVVVQGLATDEAAFGNDVVHVLAMDDGDLRPYEAIERGVGTLQSTPKAPAYGSEGVMFNSDDGFKIIGGVSADLLELTGGSDLMFELKGDPFGGGIVAGSILRIFLWPLFHWNIETLCEAECVDYDPVLYPCGTMQECKGESVVPNYQRNVVKLTLPAEMTKIDDEIIHTIVVKALTLPEGGFFATRLAAEISTGPDGLKPMYVESSGDYLWKVPDDGVMVAKVVTTFGDGNHAPFRGMTDNVLYVNVILAATLYSFIQYGDASMTLTLPEGYVCGGTALISEIDGISAWAAPSDLNIFGNTIPQGRGSPDEGSGVRGWSVQDNTCTYTLRQNGVVYAGSSLYIRVTANNPEVARQRTDASNRWTLTLRSKGYHQWVREFPELSFKTSEDEVDYADNVAILGILTETFVVPDNFQRTEGDFGEEYSTVHVWFHTQQGARNLQFVAPDGFRFDPCLVQNLQDEYYATHMGKTARRLPGVLTCTWSTTPQNHVMITLEDTLLANTTYGFAVVAENPSDYDATGQMAWSVVTLSADSDGIDGVDQPMHRAAINVSMVEGLEEASLHGWGVYRSSLDTPEVQRVNIFTLMDEMLPFSMTGTPATLFVDPLVPPATGSMKLRIIAPEGFMFDGTPVNFIGTPLPQPRQEANLLWWPEDLTFDVNLNYSFEASVQVPDRSPSTSPNLFLVEFGYDAVTLEGRFAAGVIPARPIRALLNAAVDFSNNLQSRENEITFDVQTITAIPINGGLLIMGPVGFEPVRPECTVLAPAPKRGSHYDTVATANALMLPVDVGCRAQIAPDDRIELHITAGPSGIPPAYYRFAVLLSNPRNPVLNDVAEAMPCGHTQCWDFSSIVDLEQPTELRLHLDAPLTTHGFSINSRMNVALMVPLNDEQRLQTGRDNRPLHTNPLVFAFNLQLSQSEPDYLIIRAPAAFAFREDCLADVETRSTHVFGFGQALPAGYTAWNNDVVVTSCRGEGPSATLYLNPGLSLGLRAENLYPFRIAVLSNPATQPLLNTWTIEYAGQSSFPFEGFDLWTFSRTSIHPASTAKSASTSGTETVINPVTLTFRPHNTVGGVGMKIMITAPVGFAIYHRDSDCNTVEYPILLQPLNTDPTGTSRDPAPPTTFTDPPGIRWGQADFQCVVDDTEQMMTATLLADYRTLNSGQDYQMTVMVYNPRGFTPGEIGTWVLETEASPADAAPYFRDKSSIPGYAINNNFNLWFYQNQHPVTQEVSTDGQAIVNGLYFELRLPSKFEFNDTIRISGPDGFMMQEPGSVTGTCNSFRWDPPGVDQLPSSEVTCDGMYLEIRYLGLNPFGDNRLLSFRIDTENPRSTPHIMINYWIAEHKTQYDVIQSSDALLGWDINPLLENVRIELTGDLKAETSISSMTISFIPIQDADELELTAQLPLGFHFGGALMLSAGHEVIATSVETVRIRASLTADVPQTLEISNFRLGQVGGPTVFDLQTKLSNGALMDEKFDFVDGFILPGRLAVNEDLKRLRSLYNQNPDIHPVTSLWAPRVNEPAFAEFQFSLTRQVGIGSKLFISSMHTILDSNFRVIDLSPDVPGTPDIPTEIVQAGGQLLIAELMQALIPIPGLYAVRLDVTTPFVREAGLWRMEMRLPEDNLTDPLVLPINTNDALTTGFGLVEHIDFQVSSSRTPPVAQVEIGIFLDPRGTGANEFIIVAPLGYNFSQNCLVLGGPNNEIVGCAGTAPIANQSAARLTASGPLTDPISQQLLIMVTTPAVTTDDPLLRRWYVQARDSTLDTQIGWGVDPIGIQVIQMAEAAVNYPGIPDISGEIVFTFITNLKVDEGGALVVGYPDGYDIQCDGAFFKQIAIDGEEEDAPYCNTDPLNKEFTIFMPRPLPAGQQAFSVHVTPPSEDTESNFYVMVLDAPPPLGQVVDAAMIIPGMPIQHGLEVMSLPLTWTLSEAGRRSAVSMGFELVAELPVNPPIISQVLLEGPPDFFHQIRRPQSVELTGDGDALPVIDYDFNFSVTAVRLTLDTAITATLAEGRYRITYPVLIPNRFPKKNFWTMTLCTGTTPCLSPKGSNVLVSWPLAGFDLGETNPETLTVGATSGALWQGRPHVIIVCLLLILGCVRRAPM